MLSKATSLPVPLSTCPEAETLTLTFADSSPEQFHHTEIFEDLRKAEERIGILEHEFEVMKVELAVLKEEHKLLKKTPHQPAQSNWIPDLECLEKSLEALMIILYHLAIGVHIGLVISC